MRRRSRIPIQPYWKKVAAKLLKSKADAAIKPFPRHGQTQAKGNDIALFSDRFHIKARPTKDEVK